MGRTEQLVFGALRKLICHVARSQNRCLGGSLPLPALHVTQPDHCRKVDERNANLASVLPTAWIGRFEADPVGRPRAAQTIGGSVCPTRPPGASLPMRRTASEHTRGQRFSSLLLSGRLRFNTLPCARGVATWPRMRMPCLTSLPACCGHRPHRLPAGPPPEDFQVGMRDLPPPAQSAK